MVEAEDRSRGLYTLQAAPASLLEYPKFSGKDAQCYFNFEEKIHRCLNSNKVPRIDQVAKLREKLTGHPLSLVPESIKDIEKAFRHLQDHG